MGLGKTLQCLAMISHARQQDRAAAPFLIVAPTSVMANWVAEAAWFTPDLNVVKVVQTTGRLRRSLNDLAEGADAVVTSYDLLRLDFDAYAELGWSGLLLDEAQRVKNRQSKIYRCALQLPVPVKIAITGTPLENNLMELWSLLSITAPGLFPSPDRFFGRYARPIEDQSDDGPRAQLQGQIRPLMMRRTKNQVAATLPDKQEEVLSVALYEPHRRVYRMRLARVQHDVMGLGNGPGADRTTMIRSLTLLRRLSLHAGLVDDDYADLPSAKIDALLGQLRELTGCGHRALVFSQFTGFLGKVRSQLEVEGMPYCYLDGKTQNRAGVIRRFRFGEVPVFLISLKAGGTGLNLIEADRCFLLDPWWNPATEAQAIDRVHRIGQRRSVKVYRLVAKDTVEEKVLELQARKAQLFSSVMMDDARAFGRAFDTDDLRGLLS
jgi:SNF2 family DNA or RNA helicase